MKTRILSIAYLLIISVLSACNRTPPQGDPGNGGGSIPDSGILLRTIQLDKDLRYEISYNAIRKPLLIKQFLNTQLLAYDSIIYNNQLLQQVRSYSWSPGKPVFNFSSFTDIEWKAGDISRKVKYDAVTRKLLEDIRYEYNASHRLQRLVTLLPLAGTSTSKWFEYSGENVILVKDSAGNKLTGYSQGLDYDQHPAYLTDPVLWYLLVTSDPLHYSQHNPLLSKTARYIQTGTKNDTLVTTSASTYVYNNDKLPSGVTIKSKTTGNGRSDSSSVNLSYSYTSH
ncbi:MAG: hypothetical protein J7578_16150 [Chitinophagaceae bacterium]|nr:hypothetical protein [Chitinophagaceae bacterium]